MHTFGYDNYRLHHNGGFHGDIIVTVKDTDLEGRISSDNLLALVKTRLGNSDETSFNVGDIELPWEVVKSFVADRYVSRKLEELIEDLKEDQLIGLLPALLEIDKEVELPT